MVARKKIRYSWGDCNSNFENAQCNAPIARFGVGRFFGWGKDRRDERQLRDEYIELVTMLADKLSADNHVQSMERAKLVDMVKGYGVVKEANLAKYKKALKA